MKRVVRTVAVALVMALAALLALPGPTRIFSPPAAAQLIPTPPPGDDPTDPIDDILNDDDDESPLDPDPSEPAPEEPSGGGSGSDQTEQPSDAHNGPKVKVGKDKEGEGDSAYPGTAHIGGSFSTERLVLAAAKLRALGMGENEIIDTVYRPFIIAGEAAWTNTWGAPRFGPGTLVRTHEGQDVFCRMGDPVLAPRRGIVSYSDGGLGGVTARVHTSSTSYFYLTHLSATNAAAIPAGSYVETGDIVGFCGNTGNAITTPPHVHFGWYADGKAKNPMRILVRWLETAERRVLGSLDKHEAEAIRHHDTRTLERLFGDSFTPDMSDLDPADESLLELGSVSPTAAAFAALGRSLQEAYDGGLLLAHLFGASSQGSLAAE